MLFREREHLSDETLINSDEEEEEEARVGRRSTTWLRCLLYYLPPSLSGQEEGAESTAVSFWCARIK